MGSQACKASDRETQHAILAQVEKHIPGRVQIRGGNSESLIDKLSLPQEYKQL